MIPIFQYSNMYAITPKLRKLAVDKKLQEECVPAVTRTGTISSAQIKFLFTRLLSLKTVKLSVCQYGKLGNPHLFSSIHVTPNFRNLF